MTPDARKLHALLRSDFRAFVHKVFLTLAPAQTYVPGWPIEAIAQRLERVRRGELRRLIINMPPRSLKSIMSSVAFPAFCLGRGPSRRIICVSYSGDLAKKHSNDFRAVIEAEWYRAAFPATRIGRFKDLETEIEFTARGFRLATSVGGTLTGRGGDIIVIDDPLKPDDGLSEAKRSAANYWFANTLLSRLDDKRTGAIVVVMQRVHLDDLTGFLLGQSKEWDVLSLPAIAEADELIPVWGGPHVSSQIRRSAFPAPRADRRSQRPQASTRQRRVLRPIPTNADPAWGSDDQATLGPPLLLPSAKGKRPSDHPVLGHGDEGRPRQ